MTESTRPSPRHRVLQIGPVTPSLDVQLKAAYDIVMLSEQPDRAAFLAAHGGTFPAMVTHLRYAIDAALLHGLPNLKAVSSFGVGYDKFDLGTARELNVQFANTPNVLNDCVADTAMGLLIDAARGLSAADRFVRAGGWSKGQRPLMTKVSGKRLGLLGFGGIGQAVARRARGFDMTIRYHSRRVVPDVPETRVDSVLELAEWADFLVIAAVGGAETHHMVSRDVIDALGPQGILVNIARGSIVDEEAMVQALVEGRLGGAGLDVFENEPKVPEALLGMDNVVLLSHIAGFTRETRHAMEQLVLENLAAYFKTGKVLTPV